MALLLFSSGLLITIMRVVHGDFSCPVESSVEDCTLMENCAVCNEGSSNSGLNSIIDESYVGCSECAGGDWLYRKNQCLGCQDIFGTQCLHCTDTTGCQQCSNGYSRTYNSECGVYSCEESVICDENCANCQYAQNANENDRCAQCNQGYFRADQSGASGCLNCQDEYGSECLHCGDGTGCQQCAQGYTRIKDDSTNLWYCQCNGDNCISIMDFETTEIGTLTTVPTGYFGFEWTSSNTVGVNVAWLSAVTGGSRPGADYLVGSGEFGEVFVATNFAASPFAFGSSGGQSFKLLQFDIVLAVGNLGAEMACNGYKDGTLEFSLTESTSLSSSAVTTIIVGNNVVIDEFECGISNGVDDDFLLADNFEIVIS